MNGKVQPWTSAGVLGVFSRETSFLRNIEFDYAQRVDKSMILKSNAIQLAKMTNSWNTWIGREKKLLWNFECTKVVGRQLRRQTITSDRGICGCHYRCWCSRCSLNINTLAVRQFLKLWGHKRRFYGTRVARLFQTTTDYRKKHLSVVLLKSTELYERTSASAS